jgi:translation initiation factor 4G
MTSPANPPKTSQAPTTAATSVPSYASAAGAPKKPGTIVASGSHPSPAVAVGSSTSGATSNAKPSPAEPVNGRPAIVPAAPGQAGLAPPVVTSSNANGATRDHTRKSSLTIAPNGPSPSFGANGGPVGGTKAHNLQFHYSSPHTTYNTPQPAPSAPVPIPSAGNKAVVASPAHSPSPIPPAASGGRPPSGLAQSSDVKPNFGSFSNDPEVSILERLCGKLTLQSDT